MRIIIIGENDTQVSLASRIAHPRGAAITQCNDIKTAMDYLCGGKGADLVLIDVRLDVGELVGALKSERIFLPVVGYGIQADTAAAVAAIKAGAKEYLPFPPNEELIAAVLESISVEDNSLLFQSEAMRKIMDVAEKIASSDADVLITGESGTGKEVVARFIHNKSRRSANNYVTVNCAAIPEALIESELFGHEKGAFTGAMQRRVGKFEESSGGTLLLDEISEMDVRLQAKLLRAIQEREIDRVGGNQPVKVNLRVLATSNRNLSEEVKKGSFREDLLFRLNVIELKLPPLRDRREDIPLLATHFVKKFATSNGINILPISDSAISKLQNYQWKGNVRELENVMYRSLLLCAGSSLEASDFNLPETGIVSSQAAAEASATGGGGGAFSSASVGRTLESVEEEFIMSTLDHCLGNRTQAANILGISIRTLRNKLKQYEDSGKAA